MPEANISLYVNLFCRLDDYSSSDSDSYDSEHSNRKRRRKDVSKKVKMLHCNVFSFFYVNYYPQTYFMATD